MPETKDNTLPQARAPSHSPCTDRSRPVLFRDLSNSKAIHSHLFATTLNNLNFKLLNNSYPPDAFGKTLTPSKSIKTYQNHPKHIKYYDIFIHFTVSRTTLSIAFLYVCFYSNNTLEGQFKFRMKLT